MTKSNQRQATGGTATAPSSSPSPSPVEALRDRADALYRCAAECCRQHERSAKLGLKDVNGTERRSADSVVKLCDEALVEATDTYEKAAGRAPAMSEEDEAWWHNANLLWLASREYTRRQRCCDGLSRLGKSTDHSASLLGELALEYDLEASALLMLRLRTDAYRKVRPNAD
jgi:hypothetical protein